jgi:branched-chain amino acid transport system ATP-binding protein
MSTLLKVENLSVSYGKVEAISQVSIEVAEGQIVTVIGPNGAGKTTLLCSIMGLLPSSGNIHFAGQTLNSPDVQDMVELQCNLVPEKRELFSDMTVEDNLVLGAFHRTRKGFKDSTKTLQEVYELFPRLLERKAQKAGTLSGGERQMLALGRALMGQPKLLMLDEPSLGLAPLIVRDIFRIITTLRSKGVSILLIEQNARAALQVADYAYVLEMGSVKMQGPAKDLAQDPKVIESYLGLGGSHQDKLSG